MLLFEPMQDPVPDAVERPPFDVLFREHGPRVWRALRRLGVRESDLHDVAQEVFVTLHRRLDDIDGRSSVSTFIYGIALRVAANYRRLARIRHEVTTDTLPEEATAPTQDELVDRHRARQLLDELLAELSDELREVFVLADIEQLPISEVAKALGWPPSTTYARLEAARDELRKRATKRLGVAKGER